MIALCKTHLLVYPNTCHNLLDKLYQLIEIAKKNKDSDWRYFCVKEVWIDELTHIISNAK